MLWESRSKSPRQSVPAFLDKKSEKWSKEEIAKKPIACFKEVVPEEIPGIVFLSGGQSELEATENLDPAWIIIWSIFGFLEFACRVLGYHLTYISILTAG